MDTVTKKQMIEELTYYGGFSVYPDHMLKNKYDKFIGCGVLK